MVKGAVSCASARQTEEMEYRVIETFGSLADSPVSRCYGIAVYRKGCKLQEVLDITTDKKQLERLVEAKREVSSKYPGSGKPTPAPFCNRKTKIQKMYELKPDLGVLLPTSNAPFSFHK